MKAFRLLIAAIVLATSAYAQSVQWLRQAGTQGEGFGIAHDNAGNIYVGGLTNDSVKFDNIIFGAHFADAFVTKYDSNGIVQWVKTGGDDLVDAVYDIASDAGGNTYAAGAYQTNNINPAVQFDGVTITGGGSYDFFIVSYDPNGNMNWINAGKGKLGDGGYGIALGPNGHVYACGYFSDTMMLSGVQVVSNGLYDLFIAEYNASTGALINVTTAGSAGAELAYDIAVDNAGNVYITGEFQHTVNFGSATLTAAGLKDIFVAKYTAQLSPVWAKSAGGNSVSNGDAGRNIGCDSAGNVYVTGIFADTATFGNLSVISHPAGIAYAEMFVAKYDNNGNEKWVRHGGGRYADAAYGLAVTAKGDVYVTGFADAGIDVTFDNIILPPVGNEFVYLAKYSNGGTVQWVKKYASGEGREIATDNNNSLYMTGSASGIPGIPIFDSFSYSFVDREIFVVKINDPTVSSTISNSPQIKFTLPSAQGVNSTLSIKEREEEKACSVYPNPTSGTLYISSTKAGSYILTDVTGKLSIRGVVEVGNNTIGMERLQQGIYILQLHTGGIKETYKIVKQ